MTDPAFSSLSPLPGTEGFNHSTSEGRAYWWLYILWSFWPTRATPGAASR